MDPKDTVDWFSLEYVKLKAICPIIVSAEFLRRAREKFLKATDRTLRAAIITSQLGLAGGPPPPSPKDFFASGPGISSEFVPEKAEQGLFSDVSVFGIVAGLGKKGEVIISDSKGEKIREINLPPVSSLEFGRVQLSPDGANLAVFRRFRVGQQDGRDIFLVNNMTGETISILSDVARARDFYGLDFFWSPDSKRVAAQIYLGMSKDIAIIDAKSGGVLVSIPTITWGQFSPDGEWYAALVRDRLEVVNINGPKVGIENIGGAFSWSRDNRLLALYECTRWRRPPGFAPMCEAGNLAVYDLANQRIERLNIPALVRGIPIFSYDGSKILFEGAAGLSVFDRSTRRIIRLQLPSDIAVDRFTWFSGFHRSGDILLYSLVREASIVWINPENGQVRAYQTIETARGEAASIREVTQDSIIYEVFRVGGDRRDLYMAPITKDNTPIKGEKVAESLVISPQDGSEVLGWLKEGDIFTSGKKTFIFRDGKRHLIENEETVGYFQGNRSSLAEGLVPFIPEGEKISFLPGDVVGHKDLGIWYLRNGKRYKIQNWDWFMEKQKFDRNAFILPPVILEKIPVGEPTLVQKEGELGWLDWDGTLKEFQPYGGRMIIFIGGYDGNTTSQLEALAQIKAKLVEKGWNERQFLEATYNINIDARRRLILPIAYSSEHTKIYPPQSFSKMRLQIQRHKEISPLTKFIIIGHSLGGLEGLEAALVHTDAVEMVITLDSPLKGVDRVALNEHFGPDIDGIIRIMGEEVGRYLVPMAEDPAVRQAQEDKADFLKSRGVRVFTFSNDDDWFVRNKVSVLDSSDSEFNGQPVELIRHLGHFSPRGPGDFISGHGQILQESSFLEELARILPAS